MDYAKLLDSLKQTFIHQDNFFFDKHVPEFKQDGKLLGDYFNQLAVEPRGDNPPRFYHSFSPFDVISNKAPHHAVVFEAGKVLLNIDFDDYVAMRTAAMNAILLIALGVDSLKDKRVLLFGSGRIAIEAVKVLSSRFNLSTVDVITRSGDPTKIKQATENTGVTIKPGSLDDISLYDMIICHTQSAAPVLKIEHIDQIKEGAILTSFISSTDHGELPDEIYDITKANIVTDWDKTIIGAKDMQRAESANLFSNREVMYLKGLLQMTDKVDQAKRYTVYRSTGTPIQNLAVLKELIDYSESTT